LGIEEFLGPDTKADCAMSISKREGRAANGIYFRTIGDGPPLLLLHGLMVTGAMFEPFIALLKDRFRLLVPDLRGHGKSGDLVGPYDVPGLAADLPALMAETEFSRCGVLGYSHGGAVAQQLAYAHPEIVERLFLVCTYACNVATFRERMEANMLLVLLRVLSPGALANLIMRSIRPDKTGEIGLTKEQTRWLLAVMGTNRAPPMRGAVRGLLSFDSRPWLKEISVPTCVVGGTHDNAVPRHHFDMLVKAIPGARGRLVERAGHTLIWTHPRELADIATNDSPTGKI
jgi:3-oxoadipate enol-lactonase